MKSVLSFSFAVAACTFAIVANAAVPPHAATLPSAPAAMPSAQAAAPGLAATTAAPNDFACPDLRKATSKLPVYLANIANAKTTRTPGGGAFKRVDLKCKELYCESAPQEDFKLIYEPGHPDANASGYVSYPRINTNTEYTALNSAAVELKLLASKEVCGAKAIMSGSSALVKYDVGSSVQSDTFVFNGDGRLATWSRTLRDGTIQNYAFNTTDGSLLSQ